ncbi:MAG: type II secretion system GspH family protein [Candidatus Sumerlaeaceae bacterium]|nr:type II secretion system GspH family protein [Candidatus Sumerlaeaceae bacterium]
MKSGKGAFTLIELLIVVAIISILAAIAVPNFLEAQTKAKVSRVRADQRSLATAIESYAVDNNKYPVRHDKWELGDNAPGAFAYPRFDEKIYDPDFATAPVGMHVITTPISYITSLPKDIFNSPAAGLVQPGNPYSDCIDYWDPLDLDRWIAQNKGAALIYGRGKGWALVSVGPDKFLGVLSNGQPGGYPAEPAATALTASIMYDPTNGSVSVGNVFRFSGDLKQGDIR